jgi:putative PEP-CTERM system histidine kinase
LAVACLGTSGWALTVAITGAASLNSELMELVRNASWLGFLYALWRQGGGGDRTAAVAMLYIVMFVTIGVEIGLDLLPRLFSNIAGVQDAIFMTATAIHMMAAVGALVLVHNLYTAATVEARSAIRLPLAGLAAMWFYDLNHYTVAYLARDWSAELLHLRGVVALLTAPAFGVAAVRTQSWSLRLSRSMTFQSLSLVALSGYLVAMVVVTSALELLGGEQARLAQILFVFAASLGALLLLPSRKFRGWFRVKISKHLFQHRYDYRAEWLRFTDTLGRPGEGAKPLGIRVVQAIGDIVEAPGGILLVPEPGGTLIAHGDWNWQSEAPPSLVLSEEAIAWFAQTGRIIELDLLRNDDVMEDAEARLVPQWMVSESHAWAIVPLVHFDKLAGLVLLERPLFSRTLDWEDFDLLRVVARQVASYLAEARGQEALSDAQRFDEFNRRFAFIMHDIKNLVSQLSLVTRNAERHADNPEFRVDMIATLKNSTTRMNDLLARLSQHNQGRTDEPRIIATGSLCEAVAASRRVQHPIIVSGETDLFAMADPVRLEQALSHLVQNAIDASPAFEPVSIILSRTDDDVHISVRDAGEGMSAAFIRDQLFKPFKSTKEGGFGIGAFEARALVSAMGGRIEVESRLKRGSSMTIILPLGHHIEHVSTSERAMAA